MPRQFPTVMGLRRSMGIQMDIDPAGDFEGRVSTSKKGKLAHQQGYVLPALMVFVTVLLVAMVSVEISWQKKMQREREEELIFRGKQYMRAVMLFQRKTGFYPTSIEALLNSNNM